MESRVQPEHFGSIPRSLWWAVTTVTTVGYGDVVPLTAAGKIVASLTALGGIAVVGIPVGIIAAGFSESIREDDPEQS
ncbi:MAG: Cyclic nucleotide-gated potassium channel [Synechococcus sp. CC9902]|nr:MAG: Cyclic nucleotide-gated potassium channel [Synechococcus sp. CC9902]